MCISSMCPTMDIILSSQAIFFARKSELQFFLENKKMPWDQGPGMGRPGVLEPGFACKVERYWKWKWNDLDVVGGTGWWGDGWDGSDVWGPVMGDS